MLEMPSTLRSPIRGLELSIRLIALLSIFLTALTLTGSLDRSAFIAAGEILPVNGHAFSVPLTRAVKITWPAAFFFPLDGDSVDSPTRSSLRIYENGAPLGPAHSIHQDIMMKGGGRFSHWHTDLRFSATDNSDPQINGRNYRIIITPSLLRILSGPIAFFLLFVGWRYWRSPQTSMKEVIIARALLKRDAFWYGLSALLAMYIICLYWVASPSTPLIAPDSGTYWAAKPYRTIGYPLFMWTQYGLFGSLRSIVIAQIIIYTSACLTLQQGLRRLSGSAPLAALATIILLTYGACQTTALWLLTESLFTSLLIFHAAAAAFVFWRPRRLNLILLAITVILAIAVRPAGLFLVGGMALLAIAVHEHRSKITHWAIFPFIFLMIAYYGISYLARGSSDLSIAGPGLFPHVAALYQPTSDSISSREATTLVQIVAPFQRAREKTNNWIELQNLEMNQFNIIMNASVAATGGNNEKAGPKLMATSLHIIWHRPLGYATIVMQNVWAWFHQFALSEYPDKGPVLKANLIAFWPQIVRFNESYLHISRTNLNRELKGLFVVHPQYVLSYRLSDEGDLRYAAKTLFLVFGGVNFLLLLFQRSSREGAYIGYVAALVFGGVLLVCILTVFIPRYAVPMDPLMLLLSVLAVHQTFSVLRNYRGNPDTTVGRTSTSATSSLS